MFRVLVNLNEEIGDKTSGRPLLHSAVLAEFSTCCDWLDYVERIV